jgi:hypothetical protein
MARKLNPKLETFSLGFQFKYVKKPGMSAAGVGVLSFFFIVLFIAGIIALTYRLHRKNVIEVRIPKLLRISIFKHYLSPEEKAKIVADEALR